MIHRPIPLSALNGLNSISPDKPGKVTSLWLDCYNNGLQKIIVLEGYADFALIVNKSKMTRSSPTYSRAATISTTHVLNLGSKGPTVAPYVALSSTWSSCESTSTRPHIHPMPCRRSNKRPRSTLRSSSTRTCSTCESHVSYATRSTLLRRKCTAMVASVPSMFFALVMKTVQKSGTASHA